MIRPTQPKQNGLKKPGRKMKEWSRVWAWLKPRLQRAGRTDCEFKFIKHDCFGPLDPVHSKKRWLWEGNDAYVLAISCRAFHHRLDYEMSHEEMERTVLKAIKKAGGLILPPKENV